MKKPSFKNINNKISEIIRVNHAGEYGAKRIYEGQLDSLKKTSPSAKIIKHMYDQELFHLKYFDNIIPYTKTNPTIFIPIWNIAGYFMGYFSAKLGSRGAMLCTKAVEEVIHDHYEEQINFLSTSIYNEPNQKDINVQKDLLENIKKFQKDEDDHKDIAIQEYTNPNYFEIFLEKLISKTCKFCIKISKKL